MRASKLVRLYLNLDKKELTRFENYIKSEGNGYAMEVQLLLFDYLKKNAAKKFREGYEDLLSEEIVYRNLSRENKSLKGTNMTRVKSGLYKNLIDAIIHYQLEKERTEEDNLQRRMLLIRYLKNKLANDDTPNKDLSDIYTNVIIDVHKNTKAKTKKTIFDYLDLHVLNHYLYFNVDTDAWAADGKVKELHDSIDLYYCLTKLRYCTEIMVRQRILNENNVIRLKHEIRDIANQFIGNSTPLVQIYARCFDLFDKSEFDETGLTELIALIKENLHLDTSELTVIITFANNYIALSGRKDSKFREMNYELHKIAFDKDLFVDEGFLEPNKLINYAFICTQEGKGSEIPKILRDHLHKVKNKGKRDNKDGQRDKTEIICQAYHLFATRKFGKAFELLFDKGFRNEPYFLHFRTLRVKSIYEAELMSRGNFDFLDQTDTLKECNRFIKALENRVDTYNQNTMYRRNINFAEMVIKIYRYTQDVDATKTQKDALLTELHTHQNIAYAEWLELKIKEL